MRHIDIAKEARMMILSRVPLIDEAQRLIGEVHYNKEMDPSLQAAVKEACNKQIATYREEQKLLEDVGEGMARASIQELPVEQQKAAYQEVQDILTGMRDHWLDDRKSSPELRAELSDALAARTTAPETVLERQEEPDPTPVQGLTLEEGHAVARDSLDQAVEAHATPSVEPEALPSFDPSHDIERGIEQEQSWSEPPKDIEPEKDDY